MKRYKDPAWAKKYRKPRPQPSKPPEIVPAESGPILYCPGCGRRVGTYGAPEGQGVPKPGNLCRVCRTRQNPPGKKKSAEEASSEFSSSSVHTVSGGLPTLGRRHKLFRG